MQFVGIPEIDRKIRQRLMCLDDKRTELYRFRLPGDGVQLLNNHYKKSNFLCISNKYGDLPPFCDQGKAW